MNNPILFDSVPYDVCEDLGQALYIISKKIINLLNQLK